MSRQWQTVYFPAGICLALGALLLKAPALAAQGFQSGLQLCLTTVLPALFPFFVLCEVLLGCPFQGRIWKGLSARLGMQKQEGALAVVLSWIGGYAVCARLTGRLYKEKAITSRDAFLLVMLGCCSSPGFVIGCVGGLLLGNVRLGVLLYVLQIVANLIGTICCLPLLPAAEKEGKTGNARIGTIPSFSDAISAAVTSSLHVCGCVLFFRTIAAVLVPVLPQKDWIFPAVSGFLEISAGCWEFSKMGGAVALYGICVCMSVLGLSVWVQMSMLLEHAVPLTVLALHRLVCLPVFLALVYMAARLLPGTVTVYSTLAQRVIPLNRLPWDAALVVFFFLCAALYKVRQNFYNS